MKTHNVQSFIWDDRYRTPLATYPSDNLRTGYAPLLFGFAPDGVYPAMPVTGHAVRSYRTISPLPLRAVCFLWHFPSGYPGRELSGIVFLWSPDFPPLYRGDCPTIYPIYVYCFRLIRSSNLAQHSASAMPSTRSDRK